MKFAALSDLHLGFGDKAERFPHSDETFLRLLDRIEKTHERIFLVGDVWETLMPTFPFESRQECLWRAWEAHPKLYERFSERQFRHIWGNHDEVTVRSGAVKEEMLIHDGHRVLLTHGQQFENLDDSWSEGACRRKFAEAGIWLGGAMLRVNQRHAFNLFERAFTASLGSEDPKRMTGFRRRALDYARLRRANFIITGHTHKAVIAHPHNGITFINTGSCLGKRVDWISLDLDRNEISLIKSELT